MKTYEDLSGSKFNQLTVLRRVDDYIDTNGHSHIMYECMCDCGTIITTRATTLKSGHTKSCGCLRRKALLNKNLEDLTGRKFDRWTVLHRAESIVEPSGRKVTMWHCRCECGTEKDIRAGTLKSGLSKSCGCLKMDSLCKDYDLSGQRIGRWLVLHRASDKISTAKIPRAVKMWHCRCDCGTERDVSEQSLVKGKSTSCGCYRVERVQENATYDDLTGRQFGYWTATERMPDRFYKCGGRVQMWKCRCICGKYMTINVNALKSGDSRSCGCESVKSHLEECVETYCNDNHIEYEPQKIYDDLLGVGGRHLSYDFLIKHNHSDLCLVECQGEQHYRAVDYFGGEEHFKIQQEHDIRKAEYALRINLPLIIIPYWISNSDEIFDLLNEKLAELIGEE